MRDILLEQQPSDLFNIVNKAAEKTERSAAFKLFTEISKQKSALLIMKGEY